MNRHADAVVNRFEAEARAVRVARIVSAVPLGIDPVRNLAVLADLESATPAQQAEFARTYAGLKRPPSATTWRLVCEAVRARVTPVTPANDRDPADNITRGG